MEKEYILKEININHNICWNLI